MYFVEIYSWDKDASLDPLFSEDLSDQRSESDRFYNGRLDCLYDTFLGAVQAGENFVEKHGNTEYAICETEGEFSSIRL